MGCAGFEHSGRPEYPKGYLNLGTSLYFDLQQNSILLSLKVSSIIDLILFTLL